jgi:DNA invertase Pin-like site-specific DNA recombinase
MEVSKKMAGSISAGVYVRVSTTEQTTDAQESELKQYADRRGWKIFKVYADRGQSGAKEQRPALDELMKDVRRGRLDVVLVWKFDRFARSVKHLVTALEEFKERRVEFVSCTEQIDTSTSLGKCFFQIVAAIAEFERELIRERVRTGVRRAREKGKVIGRHPQCVLSPETIKRLRSERDKQQTSLRVLARKYGVTLYQAFSACKTSGGSI